MTIWPVRPDGTPNGDLRAAAADGDIARMRCALEAGARVNHKHVQHGNFGMVCFLSAVMYAVMNRRLAALEFLLDHGAWIETTSYPRGMTLLLASANEALQSGSYEIAQLLLRRGANVRAIWHDCTLAGDTADGIGLALCSAQDRGVVCCSPPFPSI